MRASAIRAVIGCGGLKAKGVFLSYRTPPLVSPWEWFLLGRRERVRAPMKHISRPLTRGGLARNLCTKSEKLSCWVTWLALKGLICTICKQWWGRRWPSCLRHCATSRKVAGSILDGIIGVFNWQSFRLHYGPGVDSASNRNEYQEYFLGGKDGRCVGLTTLPPSCAECLEIWELQAPGTLRACPGL